MDLQNNPDEIQVFELTRKRPDRFSKTSYVCIELMRYIKIVISYPNI